MRQIVPGTPIVNASNIVQRGKVVMATGPASYLVTYDNDPNHRRYDRLRGDILDADEIYVDRKGDRLSPMAFPEALRMLQAMASQNAIDDTDVAFASEDMADQKSWQQSAIATLDRIVMHCGATADFGPRPAGAGDWPEDAVGSDRDLDPTIPSHALRICLASARDMGSAHMDAAAGRQMEQAICVVEDLLGLYSAKLDEFSPLPASGPRTV